MSDPKTDALRLLGRRELSAADLRARLLDRDHSPEETDAAIAQLIESGAVDDRRVARAYARTAAAVKGRGRLRVTRELQTMGIARDIVAEAVAEVFADADERALVAKAIQKKLRGGKELETRQDRARLYQYLMRQGFTPGVVATAMKKIGAPADDE